MAIKALIDVQELAARLRCAKGSIYNWVDEAKKGNTEYKDFPYIKVRRLLRFDWEAIERWLTTRSTMGSASKGVLRRTP
jgi:hypothetical protein